MATLGELLFYIATTQQDVPDGGTVQEAADIWQITGGTVSAVVRLLKPQEDEVAQHYAVKTIENIASQGGEWAAKFCSEDVAFNLVQVCAGWCRGPRRCKQAQGVLLHGDWTLISKSAFPGSSIRP